MKRFFLLLLITVLLFSGCNIKNNNSKNIDNTIDETVSGGTEINKNEINQDDIKLNNEDYYSAYMKENIKDLIYTNPNYGWTFKIPDKWEGKFYIYQAGTVYIQYEPHNQGYSKPPVQDFFTIETMPMEKYSEEKEKDKKYASWIHYFVGENDKYFLKISFPFSNRLSDNKKALKEYKSLKIDADEIISRLSFVKGKEKVEISAEEYTKLHVKNSFYTNPEYGWTFKIPEKWNGHYVINGDSTSTTFYYVPDETYQMMFWVEVIPVEKYFQNKDNYGHDNRDIIYTGDNNKYILYIRFPMDISLISEEQINEFRSLVLTKDEIISRLKFPVLENLN